MSGDRRRGLVEDVRQALYASKIVAYAQGFDQIAAASKEYGWDIDLGAMATHLAWRLHHPGQVPGPDPRRLRRRPEPADAAGRPDFAAAVDLAQESWRRVVATAVRIGVPTPGFSSALAYYDGLRRERLPAALVQGLRDYFGAHTYHRVDKEGSFHTDWSGDRAEHPA